MDLFSIILISVGLSMDSFAVSIVNGLMMPKLRFVRAMGIAFSLAFFQALMPIIGWFAGSVVESQIRSVDHWIAFFLLSFIGVKMIMEAQKKVEQKNKDHKLGLSTLLTQSLATSIDALAIGITFAFLEIRIYKTAFIIGVVTFLFSMIGLKLGKSIGSTVKNKVEIFGGVLLIFIGIKILIEHLFF